MKYLSLEEVLAIHRLVVEVGAGHHGIRNWHGLISALEQPKQHVFNTELYPTVAGKAAILLLVMIQYHPFLDGNKRTAYFCMQRFINKNGYNLNITDDEALELVVNVAKGEFSKEELEKLLENKLKKRSKSPSP
jgi:death-on-curing protein